MTKSQVKRMERAFKLVKAFAKEGCPRLRSNAGNYPIPTCLQDPNVIRPCYVCSSVKALTSGKGLSND